MGAALGLRASLDLEGKFMTKLHRILAITATASSLFFTNSSAIQAAALEMKTAHVQITQGPERTRGEVPSATIAEM